jgi:hypothetical protein
MLCVTLDTSARGEESITQHAMTQVQQGMMMSTI